MLSGGRPPRWYAGGGECDKASLFITLNGRVALLGGVLGGRDAAVLPTWGTASRDVVLLCEGGSEGSGDCDGVGGRSYCDLDFVIGLGTRPFEFVKPEGRVSMDFLGFWRIDGVGGKGGGL
jgi:hypothetical protein